MSLTPCLRRTAVRLSVRRLGGGMPSAPRFNVEVRHPDLPKPILSVPLPARCYTIHNGGDYGRGSVKFLWSALWFVYVVITFVVIRLLYVSGWDGMTHSIRGDVFETEDPWYDTTHISWFRALQKRSGDDQFLEKNAPDVAEYLQKRDAIDDMVRRVQEWRDEQE